MKPYHTGLEEIRNPDIRTGRANADFGQGFYLSPDYDFSMAWSRLRKDKEVIVNAYELDTDDLNILELKRDEEWYDYIFRNRNGYPDRFRDIDVLIGPIANDTIYETVVKLCRQMGGIS